MLGCGNLVLMTASGHLAWSGDEYFLLMMWIYAVRLPHLEGNSLENLSIYLSISSGMDLE